MFHFTQLPSQEDVDAMGHIHLVCATPTKDRLKPPDRKLKRSTEKSHSLSIVQAVRLICMGETSIMILSYN